MKTKSTISSNGQNMHFQIKKNLDAKGGRYRNTQGKEESVNTVKNKIESKTRMGVSKVGNHP